MTKAIVWNCGEKVELTGESSILYGGKFWDGVYVTGRKKGQKIVISDNHLSRFNMLEDWRKSHS